MWKMNVAKIRSETNVYVFNKQKICFTGKIWYVQVKGHILCDNLRMESPPLWLWQLIVLCSVMIILKCSWQRSHQLCLLMARGKIVFLYNVSASGLCFPIAFNWLCAFCMSNFRKINCFYVRWPRKCHWAYRGGYS